MGFWAWLRGTSDITANDNLTAPPGTVGPPDWTPGDPDGFEILGNPIEQRALPAIVASPWSGWPSTWQPPHWSPSDAIESLVDTAWMCLDLNSRVLAAMPVYRTQGGNVVDPRSWMMNPDPTIYSSWNEFAKQLFWDFQMGEAFVLPVATGSDGYPLTFRVIPPWMMDVEMRGGRRQYRLGGPQGPNVTDDVLHIRYKSRTDCARGIGPLDAAGCRLTAAGVLARYVSEMVTAPPPYLTLETEQMLNATDAQELLDQWMTSRAANRGAPAVLDGGVKLNTHQLNAKDMALLELSQFTDSRIAVLLGVPPFLAGLPSGGDSMTYSTTESLFDFHDRSGLKPMVAAVMPAFSNWALPRGQAAELNRDEYTRPSLAERVTAYTALVAMGAMTVEQVATIERLEGDAVTTAFLPGGEM